MKTTSTRRFRRHTNTAKEGSFFKKENSEQSFFSGESSSKDVFFHPSKTNALPSIQLKCEKCEEEDKKVKRLPEKKEEEKKLMRAEDKKEEEKLQRATDKKEEEKKLQRQPEKKEEEKLQKKEVPSSNTVATNFTSNYIGSLHGKGQPLPKQQQYFFGSRMGYDFSNVKIHTDKEAVQSAKEVNAQAYTYRNDIVFNEDKYNPETKEGKQLLAHELTHIVQADGADLHKLISRKVVYEQPNFTETNAVNTILANRDFALTTPTINGTALPDNVGRAGNIIFKTFDNGVTVNRSGSKVTCTYNEPDIKVSANISIIEAPTNNKWQGQVAAANYESRNSNCKNAGMIPVVITGDPDAATIYEKIRHNELEHFDDLKDLSRRHLEALMTFLKSFNNQTAKTDDDCVKEFIKFVGRKDELAIKEFLEKLGAKVAARDVKPGPHHFLPQVTIAGDCKKIDIKVKPSV
jgi:hypothetical protein